jgi:hypothetical protein
LHPTAAAAALKATKAWTKPYAPSRFTPEFPTPIPAPAARFAAARWRTRSPLMWLGGMENEVMDRVSSTASTLADHLGAYAEVVIADIEASTRSAVRRLWAAVILSVASGLTLAVGCAWLIAGTWDTPAHEPVMIGLLIVGVLVAVGALLALRHYQRLAPRPMALTLAEWAKDRLVVRELMNVSKRANQ